MKKIFTLILCLLIAGSVCADDYLYLEDIEVERGQSVLIPVKAHFDNWVSVWQVDISDWIVSKCETYSDYYDNNIIAAALGQVAKEYGYEEE